MFSCFLKFYWKVSVCLIQQLYLLSIDQIFVVINYTISTCFCFQFLVKCKQCHIRNGFGISKSQSRLHCSYSLLVISNQNSLATWLYLARSPTGDGLWLMTPGADGQCQAYHYHHHTSCQALRSTPGLYGNRLSVEKKAIRYSQITYNTPNPYFIRVL